MLSLFFPNTDALRLALASGIIPSGVARDAVAAAPGQPSGLWVLTPAALEKESLAALAHIGVRPFAPAAELPTRQFPCWAAALPLKKSDGELAEGPVLFELPHARLAGFLRELARSGTPAEAYRIVADGVLVRLAAAPLYWLERTRGEPDSPMTAYRLASARLWVESGWQHQLSSPVVAENEGTILVSASKGWRILEPGIWNAARDWIPLRAGQATACPAGRLASIPVELRLKPGAPNAPLETFWVLPGGLPELGPVLQAVDHVLLQKLEAAPLVFDGSRPCIALRTSSELASATPLFDSLQAYAPHPSLPRLMLPTGMELAPRIRPGILERALGLNKAEMAWLEPVGQGGRVHRFPVGSFRPLADWIRHTVPPRRHFRSHVPVENPLALSGFVVHPEPNPVPEPAGVSLIRRETSAMSAGESSRSRIAKWAAKLFSKSRGPVAIEPVAPDDKPPEPESPRRATLTLRERTARKALFEEAIFQQTAPHNGEPWAELAELYAESAHPLDAALCWLQAIWYSPQPPDEWFRAWAKIEARSAKAASLRLELVECIRLSHISGGLGPVAVAADLKGILGRLELSEDALPCRMVWLARWAIARLCGGDVLGLARGRDRLFARLRNETALAAQDTPSFLRFRGLAGSERYPLARDWLIRCRDPIHRWVKKQSKSNRLTWAGLDADIPCTQAYADAMLAWAFARLGDSPRAEELMASAAGKLRDAPAADAGVHRRLLELFRAEIQTASRSAPADLAPPETALSELGDYAVAKLTGHSQILSRSARRSEFGARSLDALLGDDELGRKLLGLWATERAPEEAELRVLLAVGQGERTAAVLPRVVLTLLEFAESPEFVGTVLLHAPRALELLPEALRLRRLNEAETENYLIRLSGRCIDLCCRGAVAIGDRASLQALVQTLGRSLDSGDPPTREILRSIAPTLFRSLSRSGLSAELRALLGRWYRVGNESDEAKLGAAIGWFTLGETERGNRILNDARERLFVDGISEERTRTRTALAYAQALAHAPPRLALGRLEELFQRLGPISTGGAASRYFALPVLELIDTAITAVVNDDFSLGPEVRNWLDGDELRIRSRITRDLEDALRGVEKRA